jgi:endonuclease/exonuclease/phosphatase family metal-dependent hydrolase
MLTDVNEGAFDRLAFLYDRRRLRLTGLAAELVLPERLLRRKPDDQFLRTPYAAGFEWLDRRFTLVGMHTRFGNPAREGFLKRKRELENLAVMIRKWAYRNSSWELGVIALGDTNIDVPDGELFQAFTSTGLWVPRALKRAPRLAYNRSSSRQYSQIAWFNKDVPTDARLPLAFRRGASFDFTPIVGKSRGLDARRLRGWISDQLPLWAEFHARTGQVKSDRSTHVSVRQITDLPPIEIRREMEKLNRELDDDVPPKRLDRNLLLCTWNIRAFGGLTKKWRSSARDTPVRDFHAILAVATILRRFDIVAIQELKGNVAALRAVATLLGPHWSIMLDDGTKGDPGNQERLAFLFDTRKVSLSGLACELVIPEEELRDESVTIDRQFARTPYAVGFRCLGKSFTLVSLHVLWGKVKARTAELEATARWLEEWACNPNAWDRNLIVLGDMNITSRRSRLYKAFTSTGLHIPEPMESFPRTITSSKRSLYDQIAWFDGSSAAPALDLECLSCGYFDFTRTALSNRGLSLNQLSHRLSDHYPLWVEFAVRRE